MTREASVKAMERLDRYFREIFDEEAYEIATFGFTGNYKEAWIKTCEEIELNDLDKQSKVWFIEDDNEFEEAFKELVEDYEKSKKFNELLNANYDKIDDQ